MALLPDFVPPLLERLNDALRNGKGDAAEPTFVDFGTRRDW